MNSSRRSRRWTGCSASCASRARRTCSWSRPTSFTSRRQASAAYGGRGRARRPSASDAGCARMKQSRKSDAVYFESPLAFRHWLEKYHETATELLVGFHKSHTGRPTLTWAESVDEALCFGWIDGIRRRVDDERYTIRFT